MRVKKKISLNFSNHIYCIAAVTTNFQLNPMPMPTVEAPQSFQCVRFSPTLHGLWGRLPEFGLSHGIALQSWSNHTGIANVGAEVRHGKQNLAQAQQKALRSQHPFSESSGILLGQPASQKLRTMILSPCRRVCVSLYLHPPCPRQGRQSRVSPSGSLHIQVP